MGLAASSAERLGVFPESLGLVIAVPGLAVEVQLHLQMLVVCLASQERKVLLMTIRFTHAAVAVEICDNCAPLTWLSLCSWVKDTLD